jgi:hypothetical protein
MMTDADVVVGSKASQCGIWLTAALAAFRTACHCRNQEQIPDSGKREVTDGFRYRHIWAVNVEA